MIFRFNFLTQTWVIVRHRSGNFIEFQSRWMASSRFSIISMIGNESKVTIRSGQGIASPSPQSLDESQKAFGSIVLIPILTTRPLQHSLVIITLYCCLTSVTSVRGSNRLRRPVSDLSQLGARIWTKILQPIGLAVYDLCVFEHLITRWTISYLQIAICLENFVTPAV